MSRNGALVFIIGSSPFHPTHLDMIASTIAWIVYNEEVKYPHSTKTKRRVITALEWATYLEKSRHTVRERIKEYEAQGNEYDPRDIFSVLRFYKWLLTT